MKRLQSVVAVLLIGCSSKAPEPLSTELRIASLSPAVTALLQSMGQGDKLVGRSAFCRGCDELPVVGDLGGADVDALIRLQPDVIFFQETVAPPPTGATEAAERFGATTQGLAMDDMEDLHASIDAMAGGLSDHGASGDLSHRVERLHSSLRTAMAPEPPMGVRVLLVQPGPQLLAWGGTTWLGDVVQAAGFDVLLPDQAWTSISVEALVRLAPDVLFVLGESPDVDAEALAHLDLPAARTGSIHVLSHPHLLIPGLHAAALRARVDRIAGKMRAQAAP